MSVRSGHICGISLYIYIIHFQTWKEFRWTYTVNIDNFTLTCNIEINVICHVIDLKMQSQNWIGVTK
jgi:hypothetical protein